MWLFQRLDCQSLVILSTSSLLYLGDTFTKVIKVLPFLDSFNKASGSFPICKPQISHLIILYYYSIYYIGIILFYLIMYLKMEDSY